MSKQSLLLVDGDTRSLRVLEVSLRKAGFMVTAATSVQDALDKLELHAPDLIISETAFPDGDGFELRRRVRATPEWSEIPFIFLTAEAAIENKIRGLELGVDDYLTKPIYIKEIVTRINILLQKRQRVRFEERRDGRTRFAGRVGDMPVVDVIQTIEISRKSGVIQFVGERGRQAAIYFRDGRVIDAEAGSLQGEDAVYRLLTWSEGEFEVVFRTVRRREVIAMSSQALLMEGMRRLDEWSRLFEQLPPLTHRFEVDTIELSARLGDVPDDNNRILRLVDGKRTLLEVIDASDIGDLECLQAISRLYFEELLIDLDHGFEPGKTPRRDTGKHVALVEVDVPTAVSEDTSGPVASEAGAQGAQDPPAARAAAVLAHEPVADVAEAAAPGASAPPAHGAESAEPAAEPEPPGPLMGGYRPSSLRLIDEAVAAAQAIEPALFDDSRDDEPQPEPRHTNGVRGASVPLTNGHAGEAGPGHARRNGAESVGGPRPERDDSGLRMIGSLGRDRAEASGELATLGQVRPIRSETARELVTILPRRITRELPILPQDLAESLPTPTPTASVLVTRPAPAVEVGGSPDEPTLRVTLPGSGVIAVSRSRRLLRMVPGAGGGPGLVAMVLIVVAVVLAATAGLLRLRRHTAPPAQLPVEGVHDAPTTAGDHALADVPGPSRELPSGTPAEPPSRSTEAPSPEGGSAAGDPAAAPPVPPPRSEGVGGGSEAPEAPAGSGREAAPPLPGGAAEVRTAEAASASGSGGAQGSGRAGAGGRPGSGASDTARPAVRSASDRIAEARALCDQASNALDEGDFARGFQLAASSIKLHKTAKGYMLRARAEQRLGRVADALMSLDAAAELAPSYGAVWEQRGRILWAARRRDEARAAFSRFLELSPKASSAPEIERLLNEPR